MKIVLHYKVDNRLKLVQIRTGEVNFLIHLRGFTERFNVDHYERPNGSVHSEVSDYLGMYEERMG